MHIKQFFKTVNFCQNWLESLARLNFFSLLCSEVFCVSQRNSNEISPIESWGVWKCATLEIMISIINNELFIFVMFQVQQGIGKPSVYHAVVVIFLEFFAWGLLTTPMLTVSYYNSLLYLKFMFIRINALIIGALSCFAKIHTSRCQYKVELHD